MKFPTLVPDEVCTSECVIYRTEGLNLDGSKKQVEIFSGKCFHSMKTNQKLNAFKKF
ncbi:MAG: hypothetical protein LUE12_06330 [Ruminococcus sp.]|nr:hypothetical protein [Ruminococcus sp.]